MKDYFIRLFNYDLYASRVINGLIATTPEPKAVQIMAHMMTAQQTWLQRCKGLKAPMAPLWPEWPAEALGDVITANHAEWIAYLNTLQPEDFLTPISYQNSQGAFTNTLSDILAHVINHGTHHRAQIGVHLKQAGVELTLTDYILYIRDLEKSQQQ
ncbi:hypothetical protein DYU05_04350 [Mucilaginibacter terrenus]|uniref:Damage-inducible protein DinB n=1 Tax=Mucilaginibacter terrenus TaxID=2482727 RepID=A0A3E2NV04_9SPHI|nr:DinB family protein [Mucilaginibacter terrenus]RFZ84844.1 hypothetical protein DYU05_04350 [Mucilaginibacter terrenus]